MKEALNRIYNITMTDGKTIEQRTLKACEEAGELAGAVLSCFKAPGSEYKGHTVDDAIEEGIDLLICAYASLYHLKPDITEQQIADIINQKMDKWESSVKRK